jgi:GH24 family phage-related lysozyme (muramidase)
MKSSEKAFGLIVTEEDGNQSYYVTHYEGFDYPGGASGPTVAIGWDCGYATAGEAVADWTGIVSPDTVTHIVAACGRKGASAAEFVRENPHAVTITWDEAMQEFREREMPKWEAHVDAALPNTNFLSPDSYGAIVSLAYNRGASFSTPGPRCAEMRAIKAHMTAKAFELIPAEFLSMRRLWPEGGDLWRRRGHEADLFRSGLGQPPVSGHPRPPIPAAAPPDHSTRALQEKLNLILLLHPPLAEDGVSGPSTRGAIMMLQKQAELHADGVIGHDTWAWIDSHDF